MKVNFINGQFMAHWVKVKPIYRDYSNTILNLSASNDKCMIIMLRQYTAQEARI
jgi:hypothetical protein